MKLNPIAFLLLFITIGLPTVVIQPDAAIAQSTQNGTKSYVTGRVSFKTPGDWVEPSSNSRTITLFNYKVAKGGGAAPIDMLRLDASIVPQNFASATNAKTRRGKSTRGTPPKILKELRQTIDDVPALIEYSSNENSDFIQSVTFYMRHSDRSTAIITIAYDPSNPNAEKIIQQIQNSIRIRKDRPMKSMP